MRATKTKLFWQPFTCHKCSGGETYLQRNLVLVFGMAWIVGSGSALPEKNYHQTKYSVNQLR